MKQDWTVSNKDGDELAPLFDLIGVFLLKFNLAVQNQ